MKTRTEAQRQQARINGGKSRGPVTDEGKAISAQNSVKHGMRSSKLLPEEEQPIFEARRDAYVAAEPEPPGPRRFGMLESLALATVQVEIACSARNASNSLKIKEIDTVERAILADTFDAAVARYRSEPTVEAFEELSRTADGCAFVCCEWGMIIRESRALPSDQPMPVDIRDRLLKLVPSIPNLLDQNVARQDIIEWSQFAQIPATLIFSMGHEIQMYWKSLINRCQEAWETDQQLRRTAAQLDTSTEGARQHRYMQAALNTVIQLNRQLDAEYDREWRRRWKEQAEGIQPFSAAEEAPLPNEPGASQDHEMEAVAETREVQSAAQPTTEAVDREPVRKPSPSQPNEPSAPARPTAPRTARNARVEPADARQTTDPRPTRAPLPNEPGASQGVDSTTVTEPEPALAGS